MKASESLIARLPAVNAASLVDAMGRKFNHRAHILDLKSPTPEKTLFGPAVTISFAPYRDDIFDRSVHNFARLFYEAVGEAPAGKVLVLASNGYTNASVGGGVKLSRLSNHRLAGVLTDGRLRDFAEFEQSGTVAYCNGEATRWGGDEIMPFAANCPVCVSGVAIVPGDFIYADASGAVVIPADHVHAIFDEAEKIEAADRAYVEQIKKEDPAEILKAGGSET